MWIQPRPPGSFFCSEGIPCVAVKAHMVIGQDCDLSGVCVAPTSDQTCNLYVTHLQVLSPEEQTLAASNDYNFDHPGAFDFELLVTTLRKLKQGKSVKMPVYDFTTHGRQKDWKNVYGASVIIFEGILSFADKELLQDLYANVLLKVDKINILQVNAFKMYTFSILFILITKVIANIDYLHFDLGLSVKISVTISSTESIIFLQS
uniref:Uridine-cytidine kinase 1-like 1a n=1 Tax=Sinocyclocheilus grahami TaxID=75366 RepID=A0A672P495_SINGR